MKDPYKFGVRLLIIAGIALVVGLVLFFIDIIAGVLALGLSGYSILKRYTAAVKTQEEIEAAKREALEEEAAAEAEEDEED